MANRADRRASAKIARQAVKRAKSPTEGAILRAAAAFAGGDPSGQIGTCLSNADFDAAWVRLTDDLHDILEEQYPDFLTQAYAEAGLGALRAARTDGDDTEIGTRLFLCPVSGSAGTLSAFAGDAAAIARLETSLRQAGVVPENGSCLVLPFLLPLAAFEPDTTGPGRVRALFDYLSERLVETLSGAALPSPDNIRDAVTALLGVRADPSAEPAFGALVGIELAPKPTAGEAVSEDELDAEDMARTAAIDSWYDAYAADLADVTIGAPLDWPACAATLAWETIRVPMEAAIRQRGGLAGRPETIHCAASDDGERFVVSAVAGRVAVGPFSAPSSLVWLDADAFFGRAEASAGTLVEHDNEGAVIAPLLGTV